MQNTLEAQTVPAASGTSNVQEAVVPVHLTTRQTPEDALNAIPDLSSYLDALLHGWLRTLVALGFTLVPAFFVLDYFMISEDSRHLLPLFGTIRLFTTAILVLQYLLIRRTSPNRFSYLHGYFFTLVVSSSIVIMTVLLGGFNAPYYAGLNLVIIAVNLLLPWHGKHSSFNGLITVVMYITVNAVFSGPYDDNLLLNNLYFLFSTTIIASSINHVKFQLIHKEFFGRQELKQARDALWGEMEMAKRIQTALLPEVPALDSYDIAATMLPAAEVGGDYYDVLDIAGRGWVLIGDVSGHGVESGLIMMMAQTSVQSLVRSKPHMEPSQVIDQVNRVLKDNIARLGTERYMTLTAIRLEGSAVKFSGKHQDILVYRGATGGVEVIPTGGAWVGVVDDLLPYLSDRQLSMHPGDIMLLFTDGLTEAANEAGEFFGQERLGFLLRELANLPARQIAKRILGEAQKFQAAQCDDMTLVVLRKVR